MDAQHGDYDDETLVRAALQAAYPEDRPVFSQRRGEQIIRAAAVEARERGDRRPFVGGRAAALLTAAFTLLAGTAGAASAALPGQPLYPLRQVVERAMVAVTPDAGDAGQVELELAERRLDEADAGQSDAEVEAAHTPQRPNEHVNAVSSPDDDVSDEVDDPGERQRTGQEQPVAAEEADPPPPASVPTDEPGTTLVESPTAAPTDEPSPSTSPSPSPTPSASPSPSEVTSPAPLTSAPPTPGPALPGSEGSEAGAPADAGEDVPTTAD